MDASYFQTYLRMLDASSDRDGILGNECVVHPPQTDFGYECTPGNATTFACMGVDGVHYAILTTNGAITDESPIVQICPMDFSDVYQVLSGSFLEFLAVGCDVSLSEMGDVFAAERNGRTALMGFLKQRFDMSRMWDEKRSRTLKHLLQYIQPKA